MKGTIFPKNQLFYGPPGTGKSVKAIERALELFAGADGELANFLQNTPSEEEKGRIFEKYRREGRAELVVFHPSYSYEEFVEGLKPVEENGEVFYRVVDGVFKQFVHRAWEEYEKWEKLSQREEFDLNHFLSLFVEEVQKRGRLELEENLWIEPIWKDGKFISFKLGGRVKNQRLSYRIIARDFEKFLNGEITSHWEIAPTFPSKRKYHGNASYYFKLFQKMAEFWKEIGDKSDSQTPPPFVFIIDEINRGNVGKIFGELIFLLEEEKRGKEVEVKLPYSQNPFSLPPNLYLIGTMNSLDRTLSPLDMAFRRRFHFYPLYPRPDLLPEIEVENFQISLPRLLEIMNRRILHLLDREHQIGHSYFLKVGSFGELKEVFEGKILPLLEEYFYSDPEKISLILGDFQKPEKYRFFHRKPFPSTLFPSGYFTGGERNWEFNRKALESPESYIGVYTPLNSPK
jgi:5-methylcytosine-specific restriction protein B